MPLNQATNRKHAHRTTTTTTTNKKGMIDPPSGVQDAKKAREFKRLVTWFARRAVRVLLFFDPGKPGTTKETVDVLRDCLSEMQYEKLYIIFNKIDCMDSLTDYGKLHGASLLSLLSSFLTHRGN